MQPPPAWASWGEPAPELAEPAWRFLRRRIGVGRPGSEPAHPPPAELPPALDPETVAALEAVIGSGQVRVDAAARLAHAGGQSYLDLLQRRSGRAAVPAAVLAPQQREQVVALLRCCAELDLAVVPYGGGTSVVDGLAPFAGAHRCAVSLDTGGLRRVRSVDPIGLLVVAEAGLPGAELEATLAAEGLTLGHFPQSFERGTLGGYAATRSAGQASTGYGRFDDLVVGLRMATPAGELVLAAQPGSAAGPDLRRLVLGSEGCLGVITELSLRVHHRPAHRRLAGWAFRSWAAGLAAMRELAQGPGRPDVLRLSDADETSVSLRLAAGGRTQLLRGYLAGRGGRCLLVVEIAGDRRDVGYRSRRTAGLLRRAGAFRLGAGVGAAWEHSRYRGPYLRDTLLDGGVLVETLETAALWSELPEVHAAVRSALGGALGPRCLIGCHVSHVYPVGASLYFTVLAGADGADGADRAQRWQRAKEAATNALAGAGATITHHHGIGRMHRDWLTGEDGAVGVAMLAAVKARLDPSGILNPGKLLPHPEAEPN